ncbi:MAG: acyltransferase family protein [Serratia liquefaciens]|nr:acyltransferase family protein [Serratia liquefaciens]
MENIVKETVKDYRKDIDGLRAIAILLVVLYHSGVKILSGGFIGVDIFFVISGFLIGGILYKEFSENKFSYSKFHTRRIKRIAPALLFMLVICSFISFFYLSPLELKDFSLFSGATILSVPNIILWHKINYFSPNAELNPLLMTWSLGVEEQFYIFLPIILGFIFKKNRNVLLWVGIISVISFIACILITNSNPLFAFFMLPTRAWELGAGVMLAILMKQNRIPPLSTVLKELSFLLGLGLMIVPALTFNAQTQFPGYAALLPTLGAVLIILGNGRLSAWLLGNRLMTFIGLVSYSWYLWHWPLLSFARLSINDKLPISVGLMISTVALFIAYLSYRFVETPFRKGFKYPDSRIIFGYLALVFILMLPTSAFYLTKGIPQRVDPVVAQAEADKLERVADKCLIGQGMSSYSTDKACIGNTKVNSVALLGDSHAASLRGGVDRYADERHMSVFQLTKATCPMMLGTLRTMSAYPSHAAECEKYNDAAIKFVIDNPNIKKVVIAASWDSGLINSHEGYIIPGSNISQAEALAIGLGKVIKKFNQAGKDVVLVEDVPFIKFNAVKALDSREIPLRNYANSIISVANAAEINQSDDFTRSYTMPVSNIGILMAPYRKELNVDIIDPANNLCRADSCQFRDKGRILYYDNQHMTYLGGIIALQGMQ